MTFADPDHHAEWTSAFRIQQRLASHYRRGPTLLAGDAAHIHSRAGGQGLNNGIGDAENLAWKLVLVCKGLADNQMLDSYHSEGRPIARGVLARTTAITKWGLSGNPVVCVRRVSVSGWCGTPVARSGWSPPDPDNGSAWRLLSFR
ncbi:FAD-dependent monooxygenase [Nocardia sp. FBN12]|uniref:FAD-dependent monooxygenase n=1 Tax=Nocardia sp. FBN12 TaxID=3419766 RepID=UPI003CFBF688